MNTSKLSSRPNRQRGTTIVEFTIVGTALFMILFGAIEISRLMFIWNALDSLAQRAARIAVVCPVDDPLVKQLAINASVISGVPDLSTNNIALRYFDSNMVQSVTQVDYVEATIINYTLNLNIPFVSLPLIQAPSFRTIQVMESRGLVPNPGNSTSVCY